MVRVPNNSSPYIFCQAFSQHAPAPHNFYPTFFSKILGGSAKFPMKMHKIRLPPKICRQQLRPIFFHCDRPSISCLHYFWPNLPMLWATKFLRVDRHVCKPCFLSMKNMIHVRDCLISPSRHIGSWCASQKIGRQPFKIITRFKKCSMS